jgi:hypothetical protein
LPTRNVIRAGARRLVGEFTGFSPSHLPAGEDHDPVTRLQELVDHDVHGGVGLGLLGDPPPRRLRPAVDSSGRLELHIRGDKGKHRCDVALVPGVGQASRQRQVVRHVAVSMFVPQPMGKIDRAAVNGEAGPRAPGGGAAGRGRRRRRPPAGWP